ncbi:hypothetical protein B0H65DRAFT_566166 [Neurospora tetraspora]|uniref:Uncharacterized protein n=1 Tax=Neurospora tetraspora TaxID=94610 RepID=A0AAE0J0M9_9PEZI|nr:hypothetical protein B0H65DRAFT_566166 [Neurospora tetraspora]
MLVRDLRRLRLIIGPFLCFFFITLAIWGFPSLAGTGTGTKVTSILNDTFGSDGSGSSRNQVPYHGGGSSSSSKDASKSSSPSAANGGIAPSLKEGTHQTISSVSTANGSYFRIQFAENTPAFNPNIIPHPTRPGVYIVAAQKWHRPRKPSPDSPDTNETTGKMKFQHVTMQSALHCLASFHPKTNVLSCLPQSPPLPLPIAATPGNNCVGPLLGVLSFNVGPHDARVFYGGDGKPYTIFGSNSQFTCFGMWMQDFRVLVEWWGVEVEAFGAGEGWRVAGELQRPMIIGTSDGDGKGTGAGEGAGVKGNGELRAAGEDKGLEEKDEEKPKIAPEGWGEVEKNWFVFWAPPPLSSGSSDSDSDSSPESSHHKPQVQQPQVQQPQTYIHYDFFPHRSFALLHDDGSATAIASSSISAAADEKCLSHFLPPLPPDEPVSIHQSTNSLRLTLCNRSDPLCVVTEENTFTLTIIQYKRFYHFHSEYEPYVVLFSQKAPGFEVFGISRKPLWIEGRKRWAAGQWKGEEGTRGEGQEGQDGQERTEMFYVTSVNWRDYHRDEDGAGYHGYLDDVLIIEFGVEDKESGGIDVLAGELAKGIGLCSEVVGKDDDSKTTVSVSGGEKQVDTVEYGVSSPANDALVPNLGLGPQGENGPPSPPQEPQQPLDLTGSDGFPAQDIPQDIPADFPADFPKDFPAADPAPAPEAVQADFGLGPGVQLDTPPAQPQAGSLLKKRRRRMTNEI